MSRFLALAIFCIAAIGLVLHFGVDLPWYLDWVGKLPGDILVKKGKLTIYVPATTSVLISLVLSFILSLFCRKPS